jgi:hypothetical protein
MNDFNFWKIRVVGAWRSGDGLLFFFFGNEMVDFYAGLKSRKKLFIKKSRKKLFIKKSKKKSHEKVFDK